MELVPTDENSLSALDLRQKRYLFVVPRFGADIGGGAETLVRGLAEHLATRGNSVELFTTCARDNRSWKNELPAEQFRHGELLVTRFSVDDRDVDSWIPKQIAICDGLKLSIDDQLEWMANSVNSLSMYQAIRDRADDFDALFFAPYLFGTTFWGSLIRPDRSILIPCLHDEHYAYTEVMQSMFRQVRGALFNAIPEQILAERLYGAVAGGEVGLGFEPFSEEQISSYTEYFPDSFPYLLYVGRKETGKNVQLLLDYFIASKEGGQLGDMKLVIIGGGDFSDLHRPGADQRDDVLDLGFVSEQDKYRLMRHATACCQPSINESFSIVIMESWLLGVPALVHSGCSVTRHHVEQSGGGLYFRDASDFRMVCQELLEREEQRQQLGRAGERYVRNRYSWSAVLERFDMVMAQFLS